MQGGRKSLVSHILPRVLGWWQFGLARCLCAQGLILAGTAPHHAPPAGLPFTLETPAAFIVLFVAPCPSHEEGGSQQWLRSLPFLWAVPCASPCYCPALPRSSVGTATAQPGCPHTLGHPLSPPWSHPHQSARPSCLCSDPWPLFLSLEIQSQLCATPAVLRGCLVAAKRRDPALGATAALSFCPVQSSKFAGVPTHFALS